MKKTKLFTVILLVIASVMLITGCNKPMTEEQALKRMEEYANAIDFDYKKPQKIYPYLSSEITSNLSKNDFVKCWKKERTYPYLTPLYIYDPVVTLSEDMMSGSVVYTQAARIDGMTYERNFVYENGDYYIIDWQNFADGTYLEKFDTVVQSIDWYFDPDAIRQDE